MQQQDAVTIVHTWQDAANRQDVERLLELSDPNIEIIGPRGSGHGRELLRAWLSRAGLTLETQQIFVRDTVVVLRQHGVWRSVETGDEMGAADLASRFRVAGGRVIQYARYESLQSALDEAGLSAADAIGQPDQAG